MKLITLQCLQGVNEFVEATIKRMLPAEHSLRLKQVEDEMNEMIGEFY